MLLSSRVEFAGTVSWNALVWRLIAITYAARVLNITEILARISAREGGAQMAGRKAACFGPWSETGSSESIALTTIELVRDILELPGKSELWLHRCRATRG